MKKVKVGVIGVGYLGRFHAEKWANIPEAELVGVLDADSSRGAEIANHLNTKFFPEPSRLFGFVDAVSIAVPTIYHYGIAKLCLEQGIHTLIEKPVTASLEQADELINLAAAKGLVLQVGHIERFNPAFTAISALLKSPRYLIAERAAPFTVRCTDVNVILDLMIHDLDIVAELAGAEPREVCAAGASVITKEIDTATARIVFHNGCVADVSASRVSPEKKRLLRVFDGDRVYTSDFQSQKAVLARRGESPTPELVTEDISTERRDALADELRAFVLSVRDGTRPAVTGAEGRRALALAARISETIENGITGFVPAG